MRTGVEIQDRARLRSEVYQRIALQHLQNNHLSFNKCRQGRGLFGLIAQLRQVVARYRQDVEALTQPLAEH